MKLIICFAFLLLSINSICSDVLAQEIKIFNSQDLPLKHCLYNIIVQTGISIIFIGEKHVDANKSLYNVPENLMLSDFCNLISKDRFKWKLFGDNVLIFQENGFYIPALDAKMQPDYCITSLSTGRFFCFLLSKNLFLTKIFAAQINYPKFKKDESILDYFARIVSGTKTLTIIYKFQDRDAKTCWDMIRKHNPNFKRISNDLFGILISENYRLQTKKIFNGEDIADGSSLAVCKLELLAGKEFKLSIKNISNQLLFFSNFKEKNLIINDLASNSKFFDANENFLIYPPLDCSLPKDFKMAPCEERFFVFSLIGSRSCPSPNKSIWNIGVEKEYNFSPNDNIIILKRKNKEYNLYGLVVYFYDGAGKKYKIFNKNFIDDTGW